MSSNSQQQQQQQDQQTSSTAANGDNVNILHSKLGGNLTNSPTSLIDQTLYENYNLKWDEASLVQKMAALKLEAQKQLLNEFMLQKAQLQNATFAYPAEIHLRTPKPPSQRNRELYKTALCDFWNAGVPCRFGERCWFAHGPHELRIARFVYPSINPYDYEVRINNSSNSSDIPVATNSMVSPYVRYGNLQRVWNVEQTYPMTVNNANLSPPQMRCAPITQNIQPQNVPIGFERKLYRMSPLRENTNSKPARNGSDGDSGLGSWGTTNSPEVVKRESLDGASYQPFSDPLGNDALNSGIVPLHLQQPLTTLASDQQVNISKNEAYNRWLSTGAVNAASIQIAPGLEQMNWWPDMISNSYPYINALNPNNQSNSRGAAQQLNQNLH